MAAMIHSKPIRSNIRGLKSYWPWKPHVSLSSFLTFSTFFGPIFYRTQVSLGSDLWFRFSQTD